MNGEMNGDGEPCENCRWGWPQPRTWMGCYTKTSLWNGVLFLWVAQGYTKSGISPLWFLHQFNPSASQHFVSGDRKKNWFRWWTISKIRKAKSLVLEVHIWLIFAWPEIILRCSHCCYCHILIHQDEYITVSKTHIWVVYQKFRSFLRNLIAFEWNTIV